jgi:hypothetical protein
VLLLVLPKMQFKRRFYPAHAQQVKDLPLRVPEIVVLECGV